MLIVDKHCSDVCCAKFPVPQIDGKIKQTKEQWQKFLFAISMGKTRYIKCWKYQNLWMNNKVRGDKMQFVCIFFHIICWMSAENLNFQFHEVVLEFVGS